MQKILQSSRLRAVLGAPGGEAGDGIVTGAFTTTRGGFVAIAPGGASATARAAAEAALGRLAAELPAGAALEYSWHADGDVEIAATGLEGVSALARAALAERTADLVCTAVQEGGAR